MVQKKEMMKAAVAHEFGKPLTIEEVPIPEPKPHEILIKVQASGVCHTDLHSIAGDWPAKASLPFIPGHEGAGIVAAVGSEVTWLKEGDRAGIAWLYSSCGHCDYCMAGWETLCKSQKNSGFTANGSFAEYVIADPNFVGRIPETVDFAEIAPVLCAGVTVYKGLKITEARPGEWVVISGVGGLGHMAIEYAVAMGLHVAAVDVDDAKLDLARKVGAKVTVNARKTEPVPYIQKETGGAHGILVTAVSPKAFEQALGMLCRRGTAVLVGLPPGTFPLSIFDMVMAAATVRGSIVGTRLDLKEALSFAGEGKVKATVQKEKLDNINDVFDRMRKFQIRGRIVVDFRS
jgi:propanol-preferring alcohol dehydrogenase